MISEVDIRDWDYKPEDKNLVLKEGPFPHVPAYIPGNVGFPPGSAQTTKKETIRSSVLNEANNIVNGARNKAYGSAEDNFQNIANLWNGYLEKVTLTPVDVANMMALMKIARLKHSPDHRDSWVDIAGYAACGAECGLKAAKGAGCEAAKKS
jgi:hypothetical protein